MRFVAIPTALRDLLGRNWAGGTISKLNADKSAILIRSLMRHLFRDDLYGRWINYHSDNLIELLGKDYTKVLRLLQDLKVIHRTRSFYAGNARDQYPELEPFPKAIVVVEEFSNHNNCRFWELSNKRSIDAIAKSFTLKPRSRAAFSLAEMLPDFGLMINEADFKQRTFKQAWTLENITAIDNSQLFMTEDRFSGRVHTNFTQLPKVVRERMFLNNDRQTLSSLDVSAMQPLLLGWAARENIKTQARNATLCYTSSKQPTQSPRHDNQVIYSMMPEMINATTCYRSSGDVEKWINECQGGTLYKRIRSLIPTTRQRFEYRSLKKKGMSEARNRTTRKRFTVDLSRMSDSTFKRQVLQVLFDRNEQSKRNPIWKAISSNYPTIADYIWELKRHDHKQAVRMLQQMEVQILIHQVAAEHARQGLPIVTVHDEIITPDDTATRAIMQRAFSEIGLTPLIR